MTIDIKRRTMIRNAPKKSREMNKMMTSHTFKIEKLNASKPSRMEKLCVRTAKIFLQASSSTYRIPVAKFRNSRSIPRNSRVNMNHLRKATD